MGDMKCLRTGCINEVNGHSDYCSHRCVSLITRDKHSTKPRQTMTDAELEKHIAEYFRREADLDYYGDRHKPVGMRKMAHLLRVAR